MTFHSRADRFARTAGSLALHPLFGSPSGLLLALHPLLACAATGLVAQALATALVVPAGALSLGAAAASVLRTPRAPGRPSGSTRPRDEGRGALGRGRLYGRGPTWQ